MENRSFGARLGQLCIVLLVAMAFAGANRVDAKTFESNLKKDFPADPGGKLVVDADRGGIEVLAEDGKGVSIEVRRSVTGSSETKAEQILAGHEVTFSSEGGTITVQARLRKEFAGWLGRGPNLQVQCVITVPKRFQLDLRTSAGTIQCAGIEGEVKARTSGGSLKFGAIKGSFDGTCSAGSIRVEEASGPVTARTSGGSIHAGQLGATAQFQTSAGSITVKGVKGQLTARTSGGSIEVSELSGPAELVTAAGSIHVGLAEGTLVATTSGGSIKVDEARNSVSAQTSAGSITAAIVAQPEGECRLITSGGSITLKVDAELGFDVAANASGGRISTELPIASTVVGEHRNNELRGKLNGGGKALVLKTSAGNISIQKR